MNGEVVVMLRMSIPFYQVGRIGEIRESNEFYIVDRYDDNGKMHKSFYINKNLKNLEGLLENYYYDLKGYLDCNIIRYNEYKENCFKKIQYMKNFENLKFVIFALTLIPVVGFLLNYNLLISMGIGLELLFVPTFLFLERGSKKYKSEEKKYSFVKNYNNYLWELESYSATKTNSKNFKPTKFSYVSTYERYEELINNKKKEKRVS